MTAKTEMALAQARRRVEAAQLARYEGMGRGRRERTRHLIELGGLVQKAGLVELADDDRATLYGAARSRREGARGSRSAHALEAARQARSTRGGRERAHDEPARREASPRSGARFTRGTRRPALWREDDADARANLAIEGMALDADEHALFDLRDRAPPLATAILLNCSIIPTPTRRWRSPAAPPR
jgi:hypothetical protein